MVSRLGDVLSEMPGNAWEKIKDFFVPIGDFFSDLWKRFGAPVVIFSARWLPISGPTSRPGQKIWDGTQPIRDTIAAAWKWLKNELGIGEGAEGQNGLLEWHQTKLSEAWDCSRSSSSR